MRKEHKPGKVYKSGDVVWVKARGGGAVQLTIQYLKNPYYFVGTDNRTGNYYMRHELHETRKAAQRARTSCI